ncbi:hypothetical protein RND81_10G094000 [Saponaria officinalis]|uniref:Cytochrome P450 n=1 Tax=Saponaria officinalis TaxID=3572 RepID=A0AAW1I2I9_SAPOF
MDLIYQYSLSFLSIFLAYKLYKKFTIKLPPGPPRWSVVDSLYDVDLVRQYGPIVSVWFRSSLNVIVSNSELAKEVLKENDQVLSDRPKNGCIGNYSNNGNGLVWANYGPHFVKLKHICMVELFSSKRLEALRHIREDEVIVMVGSIFKDCTDPENKGKSLLVKKYLEGVTFNNITRLTLGKRFENEEGIMDEQGLKFKSILEDGLKLDNFRGVMDQVSWLQWVMSFGIKSSTKRTSVRDSLIKQIMVEHRLNLQKSGEEAGNQHFVDALVTLQEKYNLNDDIIVGLLWDMIVMGIDTIAASVEWALAELIKTSRLQKKAQDELDRVIGPDRVMTEWDYSNLPYLRCIVKETLRLHPPTPFLIPHKAHTHVKIGPYDIPKGSTVLVNGRAISRDPSIWKSPLEFRPERFMEEDVDLKGHDFRLLPFGSGRRVCPGAQLGFNLVTSILGHLLHHFNWAPADGLMPEDIDMGEKMGLLAQMNTPLEAFATPRLPRFLYKSMVEM